jgi:phytoene synthase
MVTSPVVHDFLPPAIAVTNSVARTFSLSIRFLPTALRQDVYLLYLVVRTLDDLVDTARPGARNRLEQVIAWAEGEGAALGREEMILDYLFEKYPAMPRDAVIDFSIGQLDELADTCIETEEDLDLHSYRVAGTVGRLMAGLLGVIRDDALAGARALGIAMQRTNILRDIDEDLARGRIYIPRQTLEALSIGDLARDDRSDLLRAEIAIADRWYDEGIGNTAYLVHGSWQVRAAGMMYREILRELERDGMGRIRPRRVSVSAQRKLWLVTRAALRR